MMNDPVADFLAKLEGVKRTATGWSSRCPAHEDSSNSLSITRGEGGKLLLHCFTGCGFEAILAAAGEGGKAEIDKVYKYTDEEGKLLYEVVRKRPKGFSQRRPVKGGSWEWNLKGVRRVLYNLPELVAAEKGSWVFVFEGEKDCDNFKALGLLTTTNSGGAGRWRKEYSKALKGLRVCIVPDNDDPGRQHAMLAATMTADEAQEVRILELPGIPEKGDATDWLSLGGDAEQLVKLAEGAPLFEETGKQEQLATAREQPKIISPSLPHNLDVEAAVAGGVLIRPETLHQCRGVTPGWFHSTPIRLTWSAMLDLEEDGQPIDEVTVCNVLQKRGQLEQVGGRAFVQRLQSGLSDSPDLRNYVEILRGYHKARAGVKFAERLSARLRDGEEDPDEIFREAADWLDSTRDTERRIRRPRSLEELYEDQALRLQLFHKGISNAIPTMFPEIDEKLLGGGLVPGFVYVIAADPSMGKTTLALDIMANAAEQGKRGYVVTREMPTESLVDRLIAAKSGVARFKISSGISKTDYDRAMETLSLMRLMPMVFDDTSLTVHEIDAELKELERRGERADLLMVDYLQLMEGDTRNGRTNEVSGVSRGIKGLAMKYEIPAIAVSQLNREPSRHGREPGIRDLRESGQIEQDADFIGFLFGDATEEGLDFLAKTFACKKQREGPHFRRQLDMNAALVTFRRPEMLGLPAPITARRMQSDEKELAEQKAKPQGPKKGRKPSEDEVPFDY